MMVFQPLPIIRLRCLGEEVLRKVRWRVEARRLEIEEEVFSQAEQGSSCLGCVSGDRWGTNKN